MSEELMESIETFLANGGEPGDGRLQPTTSRNMYRNPDDDRPPTDEPCWIRCETMQGDVFWVRTHE